MSSRTNGEGRGRKPVDLVSAQAGGRSSGYQAIWEAIRAEAQAGRSFCSASLWGLVDKCRAGNRSTIQSYLRRLFKGGFIAVDREEAGQGVATTIWYRLVKDVGMEAPRLRKDGSPSLQGRGHENMWRSMKILGDFSPRDLVVNASTDQVHISEETAKDYIKHLHRAGYLVVTQAHNGKHSQARYRLLPTRWHGPLPPQVQRIKTVFDPNLGKVVWPEEYANG